MKTLEEGYALGWADAIYAYESKQRNNMSTLPPLPQTKYKLGVESDGYSPDRVTGMGAWDEENDLERRPDSRFVRALGGVNFPGTMICLQFPLPATAVTASTSGGIP